MLHRTCQHVHYPLGSTVTEEAACSSQIKASESARLATHGSALSLVLALSSPCNLTSRLCSGLDDPLRSRCLRKIDRTKGAQDPMMPQLTSTCPHINISVPYRSWVCAFLAHRTKIHMRTAPAAMVSIPEDQSVVFKIDMVG